MFIDGLDEYHGNHQEIVDLLGLLVLRSNKLKLVVSSRPEATFMQSFQRCPKLRMQDFTRADMEFYVRDKLFESDRMRRMEERDQAKTSELLEDVVSKSSGVFLWVVLVVGMLLEGLADGSTLDELRKMTEEYPEELRSLYDLMFERMNPRHRAQAFRMLLFLSRAYEVEGSLPSLLRLSFLDSDITTSLKLHIRRFSANDMTEQLETTKARLRSRCCGLLEGSTFPEEDGRVVFLHRTVSEFLREIRPILYEETFKERFDPDLHLLASILWNFKCMDIFSITPTTSFKTYHPTLDAFFQYCRRSEKTFSGHAAEYMCEYARVLNIYWQMRRAVSSLSPTWAHSFLPSVTSSSLPIDALPFVAKHFQLDGCLRQHLHRKGTTLSGTVASSSSMDDLGVEMPEWAKRPSKTALNKYRDDVHVAISCKSKRRKKVGNQPDINEEVSTDHPTSASPGLKDSTTCFQCKASRELLGMGFDPASVLLALGTAGVGTDIQALSSWLLDRSTSLNDASVVNMKKIKSQQTSRTTETKPYDGIVKPTQGSAPSLKDSERGRWTTVTTTTRPRFQQKEAVVGAEYVYEDTAKKLQRRKTRDLKSDGSNTIQLECGEIQLRRAKFSWFLDPNETSSSAIGLSEDQILTLTEILESLLGSQ